MAWVRFFGVTALLAVTAWASPASAEPGARCGLAVLAWVARAAQAIRVPVEAVGCADGLAHLRLRPDGAPPLDVEVAPSPGPAFARAFEALTAWLAAHEGEVSFGRDVEAAPREVARSPLAGALAGVGLWWLGPWLFVIAAALALLARLLGKRPAIDRRELAASSLLFLAALTARYALGPWGPLHVNGHGPTWVLSATRDLSAHWAYGPGYRELFATVVRSSPASPDVAIFAVNGVLSALAASVAYALARALGFERFRALLPAAVLVVDPVSIAAATTESYFPPIIALTLVATLLSVRAAAAFDASRVSAALLALAAALLGAAAARVHPVAWAPVALVPLAVLAAGPKARSLRVRLALAATCAALFGTVIVATSGAILAHSFEDIARLGPHEGWTSHARWGGGLLLAIAALVATRAPLITVSAAAHVAIVLVTRDSYAQSEAWRSSYERLYLALPLLGLAALAPLPLLRARAAPALALVACTVILAVGAWTTTRTTEQLEYPWLRDRIGGMPPRCTLAHVNRIDERILALPDYRTSAAATREVSSGDDLRALSMSGCVYYVRTSLCAMPEATALCDAIERDKGVKLTPIARASFASVPAARTTTYVRPVEDVWFEVTPSL